MYKIVKTYNYLLIIVFLLILVAFLQYVLIRPFEIGFTPDDWNFVFWYKTLGNHPVVEITKVWQREGAYTTFFIYYLGFLTDIWGINFSAIGITNITLKILATISIYPLIYCLFRKKLFAFLSTIVYAISYSSVGSLEFAVKGADYLSIFFANIFLVCYCFLVRRKSIKTWWLILSVLFFIATLISSTIRSYPLLLIIPLIEVFILLREKTLKNASLVFIRLLILYSPFMVLLIYKPDSVTAFLSPVFLFQKIYNGNWHLLLTPIQGLGFMFIPLEIWGHLIQPLAFDSLGSYLLSIIRGGPLIIWLIITGLLAFTTARNKSKFFLLVLGVNLLLQVLSYIAAFHSKGIEINYKVNFDPPRLYSTMNGLFSISLAVGFLYEWYKEKNNFLKLAVWSSLFIAFIYTILTWMLADLNLGYKETSYYLVVASEAFSIFIAGILALIIESTYLSKLSFVKRGMILFSIAVFSIICFVISSQVIHTFFTSINSKGRSYIGQNLIQNRFREQIKNIDFNEPKLFYFDGSELGKDGPFISEGFLSVFPHWIHIKQNELVNGCSEIFYEDINKLGSLIRVRNNEKVIEYRSLCVKDGKAWYDQVIYEKKNIHAYKIKDRNFIDITDQIVKELGL